jgi:hypothetical protein
MRMHGKEGMRERIREGEATLIPPYWQENEDAQERGNEGEN